MLRSVVVVGYVALVLAGCGGSAPRPAAVVVATSAPLPVYVPRDVDVLVHYDMARIAEWVHADALADEYARELPRMAPQVAVYRRATEALSAVWMGTGRGYVLLIRGDVSERDLEAFPGGDSYAQEVGGVTVRANHFGAVALLAPDVLVYGSPGRVMALLRFVEEGRDVEHRASLRAAMARAEFGAHALSFATDARFDDEMTEAAGYVEVGRALDAVAWVDYESPVGAQRTARAIDRLRSSLMVRMMLGSLRDAFSVELHDNGLVGRVHLDETQGRRAMRIIPQLIRVADRGARGPG